MTHWRPFQHVALRQRRVVPEQHYPEAPQLLVSQRLTPGDQVALAGNDVSAPADVCAPEHGVAETEREAGLAELPGEERLELREAIEHLEV